MIRKRWVFQKPSRAGARNLLILRTPRNQIVSFRNQVILESWTGIKSDSKTMLLTVREVDDGI